MMGVQVPPSVAYVMQGHTGLDQVSLDAATSRLWELYIQRRWSCCGVCQKICKSALIVPCVGILRRLLLAA
jgi:hypothetical protein